MGQKLKIAGWVSVGVVAGALTTVSLQTVARGAMTPLPLEEIQQLSAVFGLVKTDYVEPVDDKKLITDAISGMVSSLDPHSQRLLKAYDLWDKPLPVDKIRDARRAYFGACSYIDDNIGKLLQTLEDTGLADDTVIVFSGDHGDMLGERGLWYKMHWFDMAAREPLLVYAPGQFEPARVGAAVSTADLLPTFVELAGGTLEAGLDLDGRSLVSHLRGEGGHDEVFGEYMAEGTISPLMMIRRGAYKFIYSEDDPCLLFNLHNDPREREELSQSPDHQSLFNDFLAQARAKWDIPMIHRQVLASQRRRRLVTQSLATGKRTSWDHQPWVDASQQYMRNHIDLDDLERKARYPQVGG